tara:strand:- start:89 stop:733 length:645 start_codon:yes stop_codon:yes gene_type:complete
MKEFKFNIEGEVPSGYFINGRGKMIKEFKFNIEGEVPSGYDFFIDHVFEWYTKRCFKHTETLENLTRNDVEKAFEEYKKEYPDYGYWSGGESSDRESIRFILERRFKFFESSESTKYLDILNEKNEEFASIFWLDDENEFMACALLKNGEGDWDKEHYVRLNGEIDIEWNHSFGLDIEEEEIKLLEEIEIRLLAAKKDFLRDTFFEEGLQKRGF